MTGPPRPRTKLFGVNIHIFFHKLKENNTPTKGEGEGQEEEPGSHCTHLCFFTK